jgi:hypothetical protein
LHNHIADVHAHAKFDAMILRHSRIPIAHATLQIGGAGDRVHDTGKLHQHAVAGLFDNSPLMLADFGIKEIGLQRVQRGECTGLIRTHEAAVSDHVGSKNSGQAAFHGCQKRSS